MDIKFFGEHNRWDRIRRLTYDSRWLPCVPSVTAWNLVWTGTPPIRAYVHSSVGWAVNAVDMIGNVVIPYDSNDVYNYQ